MKNFIIILLFFIQFIAASYAQEELNLVPADTAIAADSLENVNAAPDSGLTILSVPADTTIITDSVTVDQTLPDTSQTALPDSVIIQWPVVKNHHADTSAYEGSNYGAFGDVFDWLPGSYYFDKGSVGQNAYGIMFSGTDGGFRLLYDGLVLNDPFTGKADLNTIAVLGIGAIQTVTSSTDRTWGYTPLGQTLEITGNDIAALPPRSTVTYRTGKYGFDDIDARLGIKTSAKTRINLGGILKRYSGTVFNSTFGAQKLSANIHKQFGANLNLDYLYLQNIDNVDIPLLQEINLNDLYRPHQKQARFDQGLKISYKHLVTTVQYTNFKREFYGYKHTVVDQTHKYRGARVNSQIDYSILGVYFQTGGNIVLNKVKSNIYHYQSRTETRGWTQARYLVNPDFVIHTGLVVQNVEKFGTFVQPEVSAVYSVKENLSFFGWASRYADAPSFDALYAAGPFTIGNTLLKPTENLTAGAGIDWNLEKLSLYAAGSIQQIKNPIGIVVGDTTQYQHLPDHTRFALDFSTNVDLFKGLSFYAKGKYSYIYSSDPYFDVTNLPEFYAKGYLQLRRILFKRDLDLRLRVGGMFLGSAFAPQNYYVDYPFAGWLTDPVFSPYAHCIVGFGKAVIFVALENIPGLELERVYGYPLPKTVLRWGFEWKFYD